MEVKKIYEGWRNKLLPPEALKEAIKNAVEKRLAICEECPFHSKNHKTMRPDAHCVSCGCTLSAKTACLSCSCPLDKWTEEVTNSEAEQITDMNNGRSD